MSRENVDIARRAVKGWSEYGETEADAFLYDCYAHDCVSEDFPDLPDSAIYLGRDGVRDRYWNFVEAWGNFAIEPFEFIDPGDNVVITVVEMRGRGEESGVPVDFRPGFVWELADGLIIRDRAFTSKRQALEAAGQQE